MEIVETRSTLQRRTNWWGAFVIGLAAPILVIGLDPPAIQALGAAAVPLLAGATAIGVILCLFVAELAAVMPERTGGVPSYTTVAFKPVGEAAARHVGGVAAWAYWLRWFPVAPINMILAAAYITQLFGLPSGSKYPALRRVAQGRRRWGSHGRACRQPIRHQDMRSQDGQRIQRDHLRPGSQSDGTRYQASVSSETDSRAWHELHSTRTVPGRR
jgi:amino acid transporter